MAWSTARPRQTFDDGLTSIGSALAASRARLEEVERAHREKIASLERVRGDIEKELKALAQQALKDNQTSFLGIANEVFDKHRERVDGELKPIKTALAEWRKNLEEIERTRRGRSPAVRLTSPVVYAAPPVE